MFIKQCRRLLVAHGRFSDLYTRSCSNSSARPNSLLAKGHLNFLINKLGLPAARAEEFVKKHKNLPEVSPERLAKSLEMLLELGFEKAAIRACPDVVLELPLTIKQRTMLLQEAGVKKITPRYLVNYVLMAKKRVSLLKLYRVIPQDVDVAHSMLEHLEDGPGPLRPPGDAATLTATQAAVVRHYLCWRLDLTMAEVDHIMRTYSRIKNKSLRLISQTLTILEKELGFSRKKIKNNGYLIHSHPDNTLRTLKEIPDIRGVPLKVILNLHPKIVMSPTDTLLRTLQYLEEYGVDDEAVRRNPEVFTLGSESVRERLEEIRSLPGLSGLQGHPRVLRLVQYLHKARKRLSTLQNLHVRCASLHLLCGTEARFERYTKDGADRTRGVDVVHYLSSALQYDIEELRSQLHRHQYWCHVPLEAIKLTCDYLLQQGYTTHDIYNNIHLLLYPRDRVQLELEQLDERPELQSDVFLSSLGGRDLPLSYRLALCLYFIERDYHFTGDGVWVGLPPEATAAVDSVG